MWINVEERLPNIDGWFLTWDGEYQKVLWFQLRDHGRLPPNRFYDDFNHWCPITHWMHLPPEPSSVMRAVA